MRILPVAMVGAILIVTSSGKVRGGELYPQAGQQTPQTTPAVGTANQADADRQGDEKANPQLNEKQKRLLEQTDKLVQLATDLKAQVDKSTKDTLSVGVIKKADEIEKLAHSMKEQVK
jgi:hypothetical protein